MASPALILRFRELTPDVDTIEAHQYAIYHKRYVWWGWWKKQMEPDHDKDLELLKSTVTTSNPAVAWLIDTSAERLHRATVTAVKTSLSVRERRYVPAYYRKSVADIPAWFRVTNIEADVPYRRDFEGVIGLDTFALLSE